MAKQRDGEHFHCHDRYCLKRQGQLLQWFGKAMDKATKSFVVQIAIRNADFRLVLSALRLSCVQIAGELSGIWL